MNLKKEQTGGQEKKKVEDVDPSKTRTKSPDGPMNNGRCFCSKENDVY